jgi:hypothetical protein
MLTCCCCCSLSAHSNAIPREASAVVAVPQGSEDKVAEVGTHSPTFNHNRTTWLCQGQGSVMLQIQGWGNTVVTVPQGSEGKVAQVGMSSHNPAGNFAIRDAVRSRLGTRVLHKRDCNSSRAKWPCLLTGQQSSLPEAMSLVT